jgi:two-component system chemotaxis response regulator CheY
MPDPLKVLIVDDDADDMYLNERLLEDVGFTGPFVTINSATGAMELIEKNPAAFHVAFLDIRMPLVDGLELLRWIRERADCAALKVVMLTTSDEAKDIERAQQLGASGYLLKRYTPAQCATALSAMFPDLAGMFCATDEP